jgi:TPR repeat protein
MILQGETMIKAITAALLLSFSIVAFTQPSPEQIAEYRAAAAKGEAWGQYNLGRMYAKGEGVAEDDATAVKWYTKAAEQEYADAQGNLGLMYANGWGVPEDNVTAYMWFNLAAAQGTELARTKKGIMEDKMTPADISKAQTLSRECSAKDYKDCG